MQRSAITAIGLGMRGHTRWWNALCIAVGVVYAAPLTWIAYDRVVEVGRIQRTRLIEEHRLWEVDAQYSGSPQMWTRVAARFLNDTQLMSRMAKKYGSLADEIELDYRRQLAIARAEAIVPLVVWWVIPMGILYALGRILNRPRPPPQRKRQPPSITDPRYKPPAAGE
ncbi:MAG TPA: hypothetical protein VM164_02770 [Burkholderiales bacterium]|nr:hypothetical protein [Burkholderiales bacterium]